MFSGLVAQGEITRLLDEVYADPHHSGSREEEEHVQDRHKSVRGGASQPCCVEVRTRQEGGERKHVTLLVAHR